MIYLDSSALMKLVRSETETVALGHWLDERSEQPMVTSELGRVEVVRAARRVSEQAATTARALIANVDLVALDSTVQDLACDIGDPLLRSLDALHVASAMLLIEDLTAFIAYDDRLLDAAQNCGLTVASPGRDTA